MSEPTRAQRELDGSSRFLEQLIDQARRDMAAGVRRENVYQEIVTGAVLVPLKSTHWAKMLASAIIMLAESVTPSDVTGGTP